MAAAAPMAPPNNAQAAGDSGPRGVQPLRAGEGHSYLWRRLHSLSGIIPIGAFLVEHIVSNFETWNGPLAYAQQVKFLNGLPLVRILEWAFIFIPLAFHAGYGVWITFRGRVNVNVYPWAGNWAYITQRVTGIIALAYIIQHVVRQRFLGTSLPEHPARPSPRSSTSFRTPGCSRSTPSRCWLPAGTLPTAAGSSAPSGASRPASRPAARAVTSGARSAWHSAF